MSLSSRLALPRLTPTVKKILIALGVLFLLQVVLETSADLPVFQLLALQTNPGVHLAWQVFSFPFVELLAPGVAMRFVVSLFFLYLMLAPFEERYGRARLLQLCVAGILGAGVLCAALGFVLPGYLYGSEPLVLAAVGAFAITMRGGVLSFFGVFPMKAWHLVVGCLVITAVEAAVARNPCIFIGAVGGLGGGMAFARWMTRPRSPQSRKKKKSGPALRIIKGGGDDEERPRWLN